MLCTKTNYKSFVMHTEGYRTRLRFACCFNVLSEVLKDKERGDRLQGVLYDRSVVKETGAKRRCAKRESVLAQRVAKGLRGIHCKATRVQVGTIGKWVKSRIGCARPRWFKERIHSQFLQCIQNRTHPGPSPMGTLGLHSKNHAKITKLYKAGDGNPIYIIRLGS